MENNVISPQKRLNSRQIFAHMSLLSTDFPTKHFQPNRDSIFRETLLSVVNACTSFVWLRICHEILLVESTTIIYLDIDSLLCHFYAVLRVPPQIMLSISRGCFPISNLESPFWIIFLDPSLHYMEVPTEPSALNVIVRRWFRVIIALFFWSVTTSWIA